MNRGRRLLNKNPCQESSAVLIHGRRLRWYSFTSYRAYDIEYSPSIIRVKRYFLTGTVETSC